MNRIERKRPLRGARAVCCLMPFLALAVPAAEVPGNTAAQRAAMSPAYWRLWNAEEQVRIDADIEANRKADCTLGGFTPGATVLVQQVTHDFVFGAHIFNFDQLGTDGLNRRYKSLWTAWGPGAAPKTAGGTEGLAPLFNSATIPFYWVTFEPEEGKPRFVAAPSDTAVAWNACTTSKFEATWRRPPTDPVVAFCESRGCRLHGHVLAWGSYAWQMPQWLIDRAAPELPFMKGASRGGLLGNTGSRDVLGDPAYAAYDKLSPEELAAKAPNFTAAMNDALSNRIFTIAARYGARLQSWDVVNESARDFREGRIVPDAPFCKSWYGPMPGDYPYRALKLAEAAFPASVKFNVNDYANDFSQYAENTNLIGRGCRVDIIGSQMHLFDPRQVVDLAAGQAIETPALVRAKIDLLARAGRPIHLSEITITAPRNDALGQAQQAVATRNLYRLWFSLKPLMGITWWNTVDDCGAPLEPAISGLFTRQMQPKPAYFALDELINHAWKTRLALVADKDGRIAFRGFRGGYTATVPGAVPRAFHVGE